MFKSIQAEVASRGITIHLLDLRWGITEDDARSSKVLQICLDEICSSRPYFIGLVGNRYGYCPTPNDIGVAAGSYPWLLGNEYTGLSITEMEMQYGVLRNKEEMNAFFYIKEGGQNTDPIEAEKLRRLIDDIKGQKRYPWSHYKDATTLTKMVHDDFMQMIDRRFSEKVSLDIVNEMAEQQMRSYLMDDYQPMAEADKVFEAFIRQDEHTSLLLTGFPGEGKSSLLTHWSEMTEGDHGLTTVFHHVGSNVYQREQTNICRSLHRKCLRAMGKLDDREGRDSGLADKIKNPLAWLSDSTLSNLEEIEADRDLSTDFRQLWRFMGAQPGRFVCFIDDFEKIDSQNVSFGQMLEDKPDNVHLVITASMGEEVADELEELTDETISIPPFAENELRGFVRGYLAQYSKKLSPAQEDAIAECGLMAFSPAILKAFLDQLVAYGSFESLDKFMADYLCAKDVGEFYCHFLDNLSERYGFDCLACALLLMTYTDQGMTEDEIMAFANLNHLQWSRLKTDIRMFIVSDDGLYRVANPEVGGIVYTYFKMNEEMEAEFKHIMVDFILNRTELPVNISFADYNHRTRQFSYNTNTRLVVETAMHLYILNEWQRLSSLITDWCHFEILYRADPELLYLSWHDIIDNRAGDLNDYRNTLGAGIDTYLQVVIANDMATFVSRKFPNYSALVNDLEEYAQEIIPAMSDPTTANILKMNEGVRLCRDKKYAEAVPVLTKTIEAMKANPEQPEKSMAEAHMNLGFSLFYTDEYAEAIQNLKAALEYEKGHEVAANEEKVANINYYIGLSCYYSSNEHEAQNYLHEAEVLYTKLFGPEDRMTVATIAMEARNYCYMGLGFIGFEMANNLLSAAQSSGNKENEKKARRLLDDLNEIAAEVEQVDVGEPGE